MAAGKTCPDCGAALNVEDTAMGERMIPGYMIRGRAETEWRWRPVRAVFCCACDWTSEWSAFMKERTR
jgi:hypothetical protein